MVVAFFASSALAIASTAVALTRAGAVHGLLFLVVALASAGVAILSLGAPLVAALHVIVYAGAIVVLFLFAVMVAGVAGPESARERSQLTARSLAAPAAVAAALAALLIAVVRDAPRAGDSIAGAAVEPAAVGEALFSPYLAGVQIAALLLFAGTLVAQHIARRDPDDAGGDA